MEKINLAMASKMTSPNPVSLICTKKEDGNTNIATVSWYTYLSFHPEMMCFVMSKKSYSGEMVRNNGKVILTIPGSGLEEIVKKCGSTTGRNIDKVSEHNIEMEEVIDNEIMVPKRSRVVVELTLSEYVEVGDHYLYICNVDNVYGNDEGETLFAFNGYAKISKI